VFWVQQLQYAAALDLVWQAMQFLAELKLARQAIVPVYLGTVTVLSQAQCPGLLTLKVCI
jgi:hypothetical protein